MQKIVSIVVPCYNEEKNISPLVNRFREARKKIVADLELILVNNGSTDRTGERIETYARRYRWITRVTVLENKGYGYGISMGLKAAKGDWLGWIHADLQTDPVIFRIMLKAAQTEQGGFLYKGQRKKRPLLDSLFTIDMGLFESFYLGTYLNDINGQPTLMTRDVYQKLKFVNAPHDFSLDLYVYYMAKKRGIVIKRFEAVQYKRKFGKSKWNSGGLSRARLIKRVVTYSKKMKSDYKNG